MIHFKSKAETLKALAPVIKSASVLPQVCFTVKEYENDKKLYIQLIKYIDILDKPLIVRSSAINEDTTESSNAGKFLSIGNVNGEKELNDAVEKVVEAMGDCPDNQVFIQPYLTDVSMCGVVFTMDPNTLGHYYVVNYDDTTGSTSSVTDGTGNQLKTYYCFKGHRENVTSSLKEVISACAELENIFENSSLDIEFAISEGVLYILQVRPLILKGSPTTLKEQDRNLASIYKKIKSAIRPHPNILGEKNIYGVMPDWNPAEMIGIRPKPLALSLYKELITNGVWAYQRNNYGYRNLRSFPLMIDFCGLPYIDVRVSFNSFVPQALPEDISEKLVNYYIDRLRENPSKHDKVEFDIAFTCYTFDMDKRISCLSDYGFSVDERKMILDALRDVTNKILDNKNGLWRTDAQKISILEDKHKMIMESDLDTEEKIYWLIEYCKRYGTLPFAGLARAGFIAVELLKSMTNKGVLTEQEKTQFMNSISTVGKNISKDTYELQPEIFLKKYGHLRSGTYDICSLRYDQAGEKYFNFNKQHIVNDYESFKLSLEQYSMLQNMLKEHCLNVDVLEMFDFIRNAIELREYSKFIFTKTLSDILELLAELGAGYDLTREDMSYISIQTVLDSYSESDDLKKLLHNSITMGKEKHYTTSSITLPPLIWDAEQVYSFYLPDNVPNFITQKTCTAKTICLPNDNSIEGKIVLIKSADPGYDWIFSHDIAGFITAYGGVNSHMAIRAAEFGLPAVIGVGEKDFQSYEKAQTITLDCQNHIIRIEKS